MLLDAGAYREALDFVLGHAQELIAQGRTATLEEWTSKLPAETREKTPWLLFWRGMGRLMSDPAAGRVLIVEAFTTFEDEEDGIGCFFAVGAIINSFYDSDDYRPLDRWIEWINRNVPLDDPIWVSDLEAWITSAMVGALTWRMGLSVDASPWAERASSAIADAADPIIRAAAQIHVTNYYAMIGDLASVERVGEEARKTVLSPLSSPLARLTYAQLYRLCISETGAS